MEKWSVLSERCDGREAWISSAKKHVQTGTKSYQGTHIQTIWVLSEGWIQEHKTQSPHISYCLGKKKKGKKREEDFPSDFRLPVWAGAEVARSRAKQRELMQRSGFGACHKCWGDYRLPAVPRACRGQLGRGSTSCLGADGEQPFALLAGNKASSHRSTEWLRFPVENT